MEADRHGGSAAYCPPEAVYVDKNTACIKAPPSQQEAMQSLPGDEPQDEEYPGAAPGPAPSKYTAITASPSLDLWALGALLYLLSTGSLLFRANNDDSLNDHALRALAEWDDRTRKRRAGEIRNR